MVKYFYIKVGVRVIMDLIMLFFLLWFYIVYGYNFDKVVDFVLRFYLIVL